MRLQVTVLLHKHYGTSPKFINVRMGRPDLIYVTCFVDELREMKAVEWYHALAITPQSDRRCLYQIELRDSEEFKLLIEGAARDRPG